MYKGIEFIVFQQYNLIVDNFITNTHTKWLARVSNFALEKDT